MDELTWIWLGGIIAFAALEALTYQIVSVWFAIGAVGAVIAKLAGADFTVQIIIFIAVSAICLMCLRPVSKKLLKTKAQTNVDSLIGRDVIVTKEVNNLLETGEGKTRGLVWTIRSADNKTIAEGETVTVERVDGVKLIVRRKED